MVSLAEQIRQGILAFLAGIPLWLFFAWLRYKTPARTASPTTAATDVVICRPAKVWAVSMTLFGTAPITGGLIFAGYPLYAQSLPGRFNELDFRIFLIVICLGAVVMGSCFILVAFKYKVILEPGAITLSGILSDRQLRREEIRGKKFSGGTVECVTLYPMLHSGKKKIRVDYWYDKNAEIARWVSDIPRV